MKSVRIHHRMKAKSKSELANQVTKFNNLRKMVSKDQKMNQATHTKKKQYTKKSNNVAFYKIRNNYAIHPC